MTKHTKKKEKSTTTKANASKKPTLLERQESYLSWGVKWTLQQGDKNLLKVKFLKVTSKFGGVLKGLSW